MLAIRYVTLAALVVWLGGMVTLTLLSAPSPEDLRHFQSIGYLCGAIIFVCLFIIKFVGPPPYDFFRRVGLVALMLAIAAYGEVRPQASTVSMTINIVLGFVLLFWYVRD
ncbi:MAG: hypothetical protein EXQ48_09280 [Acidobacteria bacterium]|nr:hypothetical protein [Acidobacteriota bacterium]